MYFAVNDVSGWKAWEMEIGPKLAGALDHSEVYHRYELAYRVHMSAVRRTHLRYVITAVATVVGFVYNSELIYHPTTRAHTN